MIGFNSWGVPLVLGCFWLTSIHAQTEAKPIEKPTAWKVDDIQEGMKGHGLTVLKGTKRERFEVEVLGVLKNHSPGRDLVLVRVAGIGLEKTGVISGMSGSPVYIDDRLVGAIAYTWSFGTEPLAGITPFNDMAEYGQPPALGTMAKDVTSLILRQPLLAPESLEQQAIPVAAGVFGDGYLEPILTPISTSGISESALEFIGPHLKAAGLVPVQGGAANDQIRKVADAKIEPGGAMAVGLITGDVSMTAVGTVTDVVGDRVYGFGHPFFSIGNCEFPLLTAYIHGVIPRQTVSSKMGSALAEVGMVDTDVSTCVAGWLGREADMLPVKIQMRSATLSRDFECKIVKQQTLIGPLALSALTSCTDMQGQAPNDMTATMEAVVKLRGYPEMRWKDRYSGVRYSGQRGLMNVFSPLGNLLQILATNQFEHPPIESVSCTIDIREERISAEIKDARARNPVVLPGEDLLIEVDLQPYEPGTSASKTPKTEKVQFTLPIPKDLPPGNYTANVSDASADLIMEIRNRRHLLSPRDFSQLLRFLDQQLSVRNDVVLVRLNLPSMGVALDGRELPNLPASKMDIFANETSQTVTPVQSSIVLRKPTDWVIEGAASLRFEVVKHKEFYH